MARALAFLAAILLTLFASPAALADDTAERSEMPEIVSDLRASEIDHLRRYILSFERLHRECPPGTEDCSWVLPVNAMPVLRGAAPFQVEIVEPEDYSTAAKGPVAADDWHERHICGASLIAPGWAVTAMHCAHDDMVRNGNRVRVGLSNLALDSGRTFLIDRVECFVPADCRRQGKPDFYRHDIALVHFAAAPGDLVPAPDPSMFEHVGILKAATDDGGVALETWSEDATHRTWDVASGAEIARETWNPTQADGLVELGEDDAATFVRGLPSGTFAITFSGGRRRLDWKSVPSAENDPGASELALTAPAGDRLVGTRRIVAGSVAATIPDEAAGVLFVLTWDGANQTYRLDALDGETLETLWSRGYTPREEATDFFGHGTGARLLPAREGGVFVTIGDEVNLLDSRSGKVAWTIVHPRDASWQSRHGGGPDGGQRNLVRLAAFNADATKLLTVTRRYGESDIWIWDVATRRLLRRIPQPDPLLGEYVDGARFVAGDTRVYGWTGYGTLRMWDAATGALLAKMDQQLEPKDEHVFAQGSKVAVRDTVGVTVWDLQSGRELGRVDHLRPIIGSRVSPDDARVLSWGRDATARLWDVAREKETGRIYHDGIVNGARFIDGGARVLSWSDDGTARITEAASGRIAMIFDVARAPPGSPLTPPVADRPSPAPAEVSYLPIDGPSSRMRPGDNVAVYGWGKTVPVEGWDPFATLMVVNLQVMDNRDCARIGGNSTKVIHPRVFCARDDLQKVCKGDSGGPVLLDGVLVGIASWVRKGDCRGTGEPGVFTRVSKYAKWIRKTVGPLPAEAAIPAAD